MLVLWILVIVGMHAQESGILIAKLVGFLPFAALISALISFILQLVLVDGGPKIGNHELDWSVFWWAFWIVLALFQVFQIVSHVQEQKERGDKDRR